jgi:nucleoside-diphosphate-sugar epimerase
MQQISILGCGWLGIPLAKKLLENGFKVKGSTTSQDKLSRLENIGVSPYLIALEEEKINGNMPEFLKDSQLLIIAIPPKLRGNFTENFVSKIENSIPFIKNSEIKKVLFVSSTSVYSDECEFVNEETIVNPISEAGKQLVASEKLLQDNSGFETTVLRFGGLIGEDRNPVYYLARKTIIENPNAPINLIHQEDCIGIILKIISSNYWGNTLNAVAPFHPSRKIYYTQKAKESQLTLPEFEDSTTFVGKTILSDKLENVLKYKFIKAHL